MLRLIAKKVLYITPRTFMGVILRKCAHALEYGFVVDPSGQCFHFRRRLDVVFKISVRLGEYLRPNFS